MVNTIIINSHNKYVASKKDQEYQHPWNCRNPTNCPLDNKCLTFKIVCSVEIITDNQPPSNLILGLAKYITEIFLHVYICVYTYIYIYTYINEPLFCTQDKEILSILEELEQVQSTSIINSDRISGYFCPNLSKKALLDM